MLILQSFLYMYLLKGAKRIDFVLSSPKCPKWPNKSREKFPCKQSYKIPSQYYKLVVTVVWVDALLTYRKIHYSHFPLQIFPTLTSKPKH